MALATQHLVLARRRIVDRILNGEFLTPFLGRARLFQHADLVEAPENLQHMIIGIAELDRDLRAGAAPALEIDLHVVLLQIPKWYGAMSGNKFRLQ